MSNPNGSKSFHGPLRHNPANPRYFTDDTGRAIYLTGSHTWANLQEIKLAEDPDFDYEASAPFEPDAILYLYRNQ
jgi:hypothetical protein